MQAWILMPVVAASALLTGCLTPPERPPVAATPAPPSSLAAGRVAFDRGEDVKALPLLLPVAEVHGRPHLHPRSRSPGERAELDPLVRTRRGPGRVSGGQQPRHHLPVRPGRAGRHGQDGKPLPTGSRRRHGQRLLRAGRAPGTGAGHREGPVRCPALVRAGRDCQGQELAEPGDTARPGRPARAGAAAAEVG